MWVLHTGNRLLSCFFLATLNLITRPEYANFFVLSFVDKFPDCKLTIWSLFSHIKPGLSIKFSKSTIRYFLVCNIVFYEAKAVAVVSCPFDGIHRACFTVFDFEIRTVPSVNIVNVLIPTQKNSISAWFLPNSHDFIGISLCNKIIYDGF